MGRGRKRGGRGGRGGGRSSLGGGGGGVDASALQRTVDALEKSFVEAASGVAGFAKELVEGSSEYKRAYSSAKELVSQLALPALQDVGGSFFGDLRKGLGQVTATGNAASELEDLSAKAAYQGMPLDKDLQSSIFPLIRARQEAVEQARQGAADVTLGALRGERPSAERAADALGVTDLMIAIQGGANEVMRWMMNGGNVRHH